MSSKNLALNFQRLYMLRAVVARFGEMDMAAWWNTKGLLGRQGAMVISRGLPATHWFAQARIVFTVAEARCQEIFNPPDSVTLWSLPPEIEDQLELNIQSWIEEPRQWETFFTRLQTIENGDLLAVLESFELLTAGQREEAEKLRRAAERRAVPISGDQDLSDDLLTLLAAGFSRGERGQPAIPYAKLSDGN